ncbi:MAG: hypothetical protein IIW89_05135 [Alistipes sp.]|nr:hypothetical protein [Alistipes sp.]
MKKKGKEENLVPLNKRTKEEQRRICVMGGKASGEARREDKSIRNLLTAINDAEVELPINGAMIKTIRKAKALLALQAKAEEGDVAAIREWAKLLGEYEDKVKLDADVSSDSKVLLSLGDISPDDLAQFITDAQKR